MIKEAIAKTVVGLNLTRQEAAAAMNEIMDGQATPAQIAGFLTALRVKGETVEEITGCAEAMRAHAVRVETHRHPLVDTCGTGGDGAGTFNVSTAAALAVAGAGVAVAKHGNRAASSRCGSADVLEALGVRVDLPPERMGQCIDEVGIGFLFAPLLHTSMKHAAGPRKELGIRTIFNLLGPLTNPAGADRQLVGVFAPEYTEPLAQVLRALGSRRVLVVHGAGGLDEISVVGSSQFSELKDGEVSTYQFAPDQVGMRLYRVEDLAGGTPEENAAHVQGVLDGERGARRDITLLNAAAALWMSGAVNDLEEGLSFAAESLDSGAARRKLEQLREFTRRP
ncbi:MAG: anthranilate phosphoribosyltransferase [Thermaerobacter sp.]|jgi:anthranilate phosphoribosyltransferase|nr:anthranilate phosphoribosyltransferase [Thermaerobacter sp.]